MSETTSVAILAPRGSYRSSPYIEAAQKHGIPIVLISDGEPWLTRYDIPGFTADFSDSGEAIEYICNELQGTSISAVIGTDDSVMELAAAVSEKLGIPSNSPQAMKITRRKDLSRQFLATDTLRVPKVTIIDLNKDSEQQIGKVEFPCVVKPINLSASRGVIRADNRFELLAAITRVRNILEREFGDQMIPKMLVESYISGSEHAIEGYLSDGSLELICIFDKPDPLHGPYFEETYYVTPSSLDSKTEQEMISNIETACGVYGLRQGPIHAEVRVDDSNDIWILEIAARTIGGDCARLFELVTGNSLEEYVLLRTTQGHHVELAFEGAAGILMIPVERDGIVRRIEGVTEAQSVSGILEVNLNVREGQRLTAWPEGGSYPGFVYARSSTPQEVEQALRESHAHMNIVVMPEFSVQVQ